jgi:hypothetical protein
MTTIIEYGWMNTPWMNSQWMNSVVTASNGMQAELAIADEKPNGMQEELAISTEKAMGLQVLNEIIDGSKPNGMQAELIISNSLAEGIQASLQIVGLKASGIQSLLGIDSGSRAAPYQVTEVRHTFKSCGGGWMADNWMTGNWMSDLRCVFLGMQVDAGIENQIPEGMQATLIINGSKANGVQSELQVDTIKAMGMQVEGAGAIAEGMQVRIALYNTNQLRILCEFLSRGTSGNNWTASSQAAGDFDPVNLNTDIVEQVWRSTSTGTQILTCDAQNAVLVDTLAILNHNFSRGAIITLQASNESDFSVIDINESLQYTDTNIFWISAELPIAAYRYWRIFIDDINNPDGYVQVGTIIFGTAQIFQGECFVDDIRFGLEDFADVVRTEGFTNVSNSRSLRRKLGLDFRFLNSFKNNFEILRELFITYRTTHKCLWIPTPDATDMEATARYAVFAKLTTLPMETHRSPSNDLDYASFDIDLDESR